jgi:hypothetical protein
MTITTNNHIRAALVADTNNPLADDTWAYSINPLPDTCKTDEDILNLLNADESQAVFLYEGPDYEGDVLDPSPYVNKNIVAREFLFSPFEHNPRQIQFAVEADDEDDTWPRECHHLHWYDATHPEEAP